MSWVLEYEAGVPFRMRYRVDRPREVRRCPSSWPHEPHGPWRTGEVVPLSEVGAVSFDCPGVPIPSPAAVRTEKENR